MVETSSLEQGIRDWLRRDAELKAELGDLDARDDIATLRHRDALLEDALGRDFGLAPAPGVHISWQSLATARGLIAHFRQFVPESDEVALATQLYFHGGGFISGRAAGVVNDAVLSHRAAESGVQILSLDYPLAPEHQYPDAASWSIAALFALIAEADWWRVDPHRIGVSGASAGGHLAAVSALRWRDLVRTAEDIPPLRHMLLEIPAVSLELSFPSVREFATEADVTNLGTLVDLYIPPGTRDDYADPSTAVDLTDLPRTLIMSAELDPLRDGAERFAQRLKSAGTDTVVRRGLGQLHGTSSLFQTVPSSRLWQNSAAKELRHYLHDG